MIAFLPGVIADDFTGAMDAGVQFAINGLSSRLILQTINSIPPSPEQVVVINTNSREIDAKLAAARCSQAARTLAGRSIFKKIDSTMRGHIGSEIEAIMAESGFTKSIICPAAPAQGRIVRNGQIFVNGIPLHASSFRNDPAFPAHTSSLIDLVGRPTTHLSGTIVHGPIDEFNAAIAAAPTSFVTMDAETDEDLLRIFQAGGSNSKFLLCGSFSLARVWARSIARSVNPTLINGKTSKVLIIAGSANPSARAQIQNLARYADVGCWPIDANISLTEQSQLINAAIAQTEGTRITILHSSAIETLHQPAWYQFSNLVSRLGAKLLAELKPDILLIIGGETANHLCNALSVQAVDLLGEAAPGIPYGRLRGGLADNQLVISKAGGFGDGNCLEKIFQ